MILDYVKLSYSNLKTRKLRTALTLLGILIGIAAVVSLVSLGKGMQQAINEQFLKMGVDKVIISPGAGIFVGGELVARKLTDYDLDIIKKTKGVKLAGGIVVKSAKIKSKDKTKFLFVHGFPQDESKKIIEEMQWSRVREGRNLKEEDRYKAVIGYRLADALVFDDEIKIGNKIEIEGKKFDVVGILARIGEREHDSSLYIPLDTAREIFNTPNELYNIIAQVEPGFKPSDVAENIKKELRKERNLEKGKEDFTVQTSEQLLESFGIILNVVQIVLIGIAAISLVVGGIGIMNSMYTAVLERTREIGIMKAIGAKNTDIFYLFVLEAGLLGLIGGGIGILLGISFSKMVEYFAYFYIGTDLIKVYFPYYLIIGALAFSFFIGCISGITPAINASRMKPIEALRYT